MVMFLLIRLISSLSLFEHRCLLLPPRHHIVQPRVQVGNSVDHSIDGVRRAGALQQGDGVQCDRSLPRVRPGSEVTYPVVDTISLLTVFVN